tara:strand:- start:327 stop:497 length:171 start_codon:yes stop_codon:yes gene_type:complete
MTEQEEECYECNGCGFIETTNPSMCSVPVSDCCGGCYGEVGCDTCQGTGKIEKEDE